MTNIDSTSFSLKTVPDTWVEAQEEAGGIDNTPIKNNRAVNVVPFRDEADAITGIVAAFCMSVITGTCWYLYEIEDVLTTPWLAIPVGVLIAVAVRLGSGPDHGDVRATIALIFYILTVFITAFFIESHDYQLVFGRRPGFADLQTELVRDRLTQPATMIGWIVGVFAVLQTGFALSNKRGRTTKRSTNKRRTKRR
jgi:hypothetical protein